MQYNLQHIKCLFYYCVYYHVMQDSRYTNLNSYAYESRFALCSLLDMNRGFPSPVYTHSTMATASVVCISKFGYGQRYFLKVGESSYCFAAPPLTNLIVVFCHYSNRTVCWDRSTPDCSFERQTGAETQLAKQAHSRGKAQQLSWTR